MEGQNRHLDAFLQFYSQAEAGNGLTRGLESALAKATYASTRLDRELFPALLAGEMRAFFLNLLMFKKQLMATPAGELLLTENDYQIYRVKQTPQQGIALSTL